MTLQETTWDPTWDKIAPGYDAFVTPSHLWLGEEALRRAGLRAGMRFLDVAAGSGALSIPAARRGAQVLATDRSPTMIEHLDRRARQEGLNIETRVMDGHALGLEDESFDLAGSQFGVMLFPDLPRALREMVRVTRPGGKVLMVTFGNPRQIEFFSFFIRAIQAAVPGFTGPPLDPPPLPFQITDPEVFRRRMAEAGLRDITIDATTERMEFTSGKQLWDWLLGSNPLATMMTANLSPEQVEVVQGAMEQLIRERAGGNGVAILTAPIHIGVGTKD